MTTMDVYVRVSRVGKRRELGEAYRSPGIQLDECQRWAEREGVTIGKRITDEDVSGGKAIADRGLEELVRRAEQGASQGVIVYALDRFGRDELDAALAIKKLHDAGARLVSATEGVDSSRSDQGSKMALKLHLMFAEAYLDRVRSNWKATTERVIGEGIHITSKPATGYVRKDRVEPAYNDRGELIPNGRLLVEPREAAVVREAFEMRAKGISYGRITRHAGERLGRDLGKSTVRAWIRNSVYLGEARRGKLVNKEAHEAIVTPELFAAANRAKSEFHPRSEVSDQALLGGLVRCAGCGHKMGIVGSGERKGRKASYVCAKQFAAGRCEGCAAAVALVDGVVLSVLSGETGEIIDTRPDLQAQWLAAKAVLDKAEEQLNEWLDDPSLMEGLSPESRKRGILAREEAVEKARAELHSLDDPDLEGMDVVQPNGGSPLVIPATKDAYRRMLRKLVREVRVAKADPKRRRWQPIEERVEIDWQPGIAVRMRDETAAA
jgi:site-specific DNA recombinase